MAAKRKLTAEELDGLHDSGEAMTGHLDSKHSRRPGLEIQRVSVDFPKWMIESLDEEAGRLGIPRHVASRATFTMNESFELDRSYFSCTSRADPLRG